MTPGQGLSLAVIITLAHVESNFTFPLRRSSDKNSAIATQGEKPRGMLVQVRT